MMQTWKSVSLFSGRFAKRTPFLLRDFRQARLKSDYSAPAVAEKSAAKVTRFSLQVCEVKQKFDSIDSTQLSELKDEYDVYRLGDLKSLRQNDRVIAFPKAQSTELLGSVSAAFEPTSASNQYVTANAATEADSASAEEQTTSEIVVTQSQPTPPRANDLFSPILTSIESALQAHPAFKTFWMESRGIEPLVDMLLCDTAHPSAREGALSVVHSMSSNERCCLRLAEIVTHDKLHKISEHPHFSAKSRERLTSLATKVKESGRDAIAREIEDRLSAIVGLEGVKRKLRELMKSVQMDIRRREQGFRIFPGDTRPTTHMVFQGNPGTGKTSIARVVPDLLHKMGVLPSPKFIELQREDLVGPYIGHTEDRLRRILDGAAGGVVFVDEAYRLSETASSEPDSKDFGKIVVEGIMAEITKDRKDGPIFIFAGYPEPMQRFLDLNPGIRRRIPYIFEFDDYTPQELSQIFTKKVRAAGFELATEVPDFLSTIFETSFSPDERALSNAALAVRLFEFSKTSLDVRLSKSAIGTELVTLTLSDLENAVVALKETSSLSAKNLRLPHAKFNDGRPDFSL